MNPLEVADRPVHSQAWMMQTQLTFAVALGAMGWGITLLPVTFWARGYLLMGLLLTVVASINLAKTIRDNHEASRVTTKVEGAKIEKFLMDQDPTV